MSGTQRGYGNYEDKNIIPLTENRTSASCCTDSSIPTESSYSDLIIYITGSAMDYTGFRLGEINIICSLS
jgi:hypothetical protein